MKWTLGKSSLEQPKEHIMVPLNNPLAHLLQVKPTCEVGKTDEVLLFEVVGESAEKVP